ncbi:SRPBCC family protein [Mycobacterium interjectum]|uniref:SRPBCC family protein n=1 Tax=Mycobacterium interjectum TaxID=33895 RepID=UPI00083704F7|nr:SRPBCC domain-containing protein [Mycobacterium interjectum]MCV7089793.1 SRPBCC domain-containing protein [Mycobacterium interjectum]
MYEIRHRIGIRAPMREVLSAVSAPEGISKWWSRDVRGMADDHFAVYFGGPEPSAVMRVDCDSHACTWTCLQGPAEWTDTLIVFDLRRDGDETVVVFTHAGWREPVEFMHHCSTRWGQFLLSLKSTLEGGPSTRWPDDVAVSSWR